MKKLFFIFYLFLYIVPLGAIDKQRIIADAQTWATLCAPLTAEHKELFANLFYLSYQQAALDEQATLTFMTVEKLSPLVFEQLRTYDLVMPSTQNFVRSSKQFFTLITKRHQLYATWNYCAEHIASLDNPLVQEMLGIIKDAGKALIINALTERDMATHIPLFEKQLKESSQQFMAINFFFQKESSHDDDASLLFDRLLSLQYRIKKITSLLDESFAILYAHQTHLISVTQHFFAAYYNALYPLLAEGNQRLLFCLEGKIQEQNHPPLPTHLP